MDKTNIKELASVCGVSVATVSRVFSGNGKVSEATRTKILRAAIEFNYTPQQTSRRDNVAIIVPSSLSIQPPSWFSATLVGQLTRDIYHAGFAPRLYEITDLELIKSNFNVAAVLIDWLPNPGQAVELLQKRRPVIMVNACNDNTFSVCINYADGVRRAVQYLYERGHRKIGLVSPTVPNWGNSQRLEGFKNAMEECGLEYSAQLIAHEKNNGWLSLDSLARLLQRGVSALICPHEDWTLQLHYSLNILGKSIPNDISVISADVEGINQWLNPPQTAMLQDMEGICQAVVSRLNVCVDAQEQLDAQRIDIAYKFIERESVLTLDR